MAHPTISPHEIFGKTNPPRQKHLKNQSNNSDSGARDRILKRRTRTAVPGITPRGRRANARKCDQRYFFFAGSLPMSLIALYICWNGGCGPVSFGAGAAFAAFLAFLAAAA